jgi:uncharacterized membrane protein
MDPGWDMVAGGWLWMGAWILAIIVMVWLITRSPGSSGQIDDSSEILRARYARGEITQAEYEHAKRVLGSEKESRS